MTNQDMLDDLKQFIDARFAQQDADFDQKLDEKLDQKLDEKLDQKLDEKLAPIQRQIQDLTGFVSDAIDASNDIHGAQLADLETRLVRLEKRAA